MFPSQVDDLRRAKPIYETLPGWQQEISGVREIAELPASCPAISPAAGRTVGRPVEIASVGPDREQTMFADEVSGAGDERLRLLDLRMTAKHANRRQLPRARYLEVPLDKRPRHIAIIMDGNGRWAQRRGLPRIEGHRHGVASVSARSDGRCGAAGHRPAHAVLPVERELEAAAGANSIFSCTCSSSTWSKSGKRCWKRRSGSTSSAGAKAFPPACCARWIRPSRSASHNTGMTPVPGHQLRQPGRDGRRRADHRRKVRAGCLSRTRQRRDDRRPSVHGRHA